MDETRDEKIAGMEAATREYVEAQGFVWADAVLLWWLPSAEADFVTAPTANHAVPAVVAELRRGAAAF